jgi:hypothetical protein
MDFTRTTACLRQTSARHMGFDSPRHPLETLPPADKARAARATPLQALGSIHGRCASVATYPRSRSPCVARQAVTIWRSVAKKLWSFSGTVPLLSALVHPTLRQPASTLASDLKHPCPCRHQTDLDPGLRRRPRNPQGGSSAQEVSTPRLAQPWPCLRHMRAPPELGNNHCPQPRP